MLNTQFERLSQYNAVMNRKIMDSINGLSEEILWEDKGAFFGSILGALNHILVGDLIWLRRFNQHPNYSDGFIVLEQLASFPVPKRLDKPLYTTLSVYEENRTLLDDIIIGFMDEISVADYDMGLKYTNTKNLEFKKPFGLLLLHFFNHQTHHRGQVTTLLNQINIDVGSTDLLMLID